jgi:hypothetical protein
MAVLVAPRPGARSLAASAVVKPYPVGFVALLPALLREASTEVARSKLDPKLRAQIAELVAGLFGILTRSDAKATADSTVS